jgi:alpha-tubulin suppressor-like RCC1 family protein
VGLAHSCAALANGSVACWGINDAGQLGNGTTSGSATPTAVAGGGATVTGAQLAAGGSHSCALRAGGGVACWGANGSGQLGFVGLTAQLVPTAAPLADATAVTAGASHTCALAAGEVRCWGANASGQLGDGTVVGRPTPRPVPLPNKALLLAAGDAHTCALVSSLPYCWGENGDGQLGNGSLDDRALPVEVQVGGIKSIATGRAHTCALSANGAVRCWGDNANGQFGDGTTTDTTLPERIVAGISTAIAIAAGDSHTCALLADGTVRCWGGNGSGQIGDGSRTQRTVPATPIGLTNVVAIAAGGSHTCAVRADGTASCWGANARGQLGDGTTTQRLVPTPVTIQLFQRTFSGGSLITVPLGGILQVAAGRLHTCAASVNGSVRCWGAGASGELGLGATTDQLRPTQVPSFTLNIDPHVELRASGRVAAVAVVAICEPGERLRAEVALTQGDASGTGVAVGACTGAVEHYPANVAAHGRSPFGPGPATVAASAVVGIPPSGDRHEWSRAVQLVPAP